MKHSPGRYPACWLVVMCVLLGPQIQAGPPVETGIAVEKRLVHVTDLSGQVHRGKLIELTETTVQIASTPPVSWKRADVLRLDWPNQPSGLLEESPQLLLANGDRLGISPTEMDEEFLRGKWKEFAAWPKVKVPLETLRGVVLLPQRGLLERSRILSQLRDQKETNDIFYLANGDRLLGEMEGLENKTLRLKTAAGQTTLAVESVQAFGMNPELTSFPATKEPVALLFLEDGSQLTVGALRLDNAAELLNCHATFGSDLQIPLEKILSLQFLSERVIFLSDLEPAEYLSTPYFTRVWPLQRNRNAIGGPLRLENREFARGLGVHGQALVTYDLKAEYSNFQATIGIDAAADGRGSVIFRVLADGKPVFTSEVVRGKTNPISIGPLSMEGVNRLILSTDFADEGDMLDHADWCDALLIKKPN
jgi:hypothetical protein